MKKKYVLKRHSKYANKKYKKRSKKNDPSKLRLKIIEKYLNKNDEVVGFLTDKISNYRFCPSCGGELYRKENYFFCENDFCTFSPLIIIKEEGK